MTRATRHRFFDLDGPIPGFKTLSKHPRVQEVENAGMDEGRFFVHLHRQWNFATDPGGITRTMSFGSFRDAMAAIKAAVPCDPNERSL